MRRNAKLRGESGKRSDAPQAQVSQRERELGWFGLAETKDGGRVQLWAVKLPVTAGAIKDRVGALFTCLQHSSARSTGEKSTMSVEQRN